MKLTSKQLKKLIENALSSERPWWHGPFESDWDREMRKLCDEGYLEACEKIEPRMKGPTDEEWNAEMKRMGLIEMKITNKKIRQIIKEELDMVLKEVRYSPTEIYMDLMRRGGPDYWLSQAHGKPMKCSDFMHWDQALRAYIDETDPSLIQMPNNIWNQITQLMKNTVQ